MAAKTKAKSKTHRFQARVSTARVAKANRVSRQSFWNWRQEHIVEPLRRVGIEPPQDISLQSCWSISIARALKKDGMASEVCQKVSEFLDAMRPEAIEQAFGEGRTYVVIASGEVFNNLLPIESIKTRYVQDALLRAIDAGKPLTLRAINVEPLLKELVELAKAEDEPI